MNSVPSKLEHKDIDELYQKNKVKSIGFLVILIAALLLIILLSLRAGSYETPMGELVKGIFGQSSDRKINIVVRNNRLPRILTAILAGGGLGLAGCVLQAVLRNPLAWACRRAHPAARPLPLLYGDWVPLTGLVFRCAPFSAPSPWHW